jgi:hypothetical protein
VPHHALTVVSDIPYDRRDVSVAMENGLSPGNLFQSVPVYLERKVTSRCELGVNLNQ